MSLLTLLISAIRRQTSKDTPLQEIQKSIKRQAKLTTKVNRILPYFRIALLIAGLIYFSLLSSKPLGREHHVSENALQPAQVNTYWNWADVHVADGYANDMDRWSRLELSDRANALRDAFSSLGLSTSTQSYKYHLPSTNQTIAGTNVYAILKAPKTDGAEALVLSASWLSRALDENGEKRINMRGIATVLALANYLQKYSMWSKDIIFLLSDGYSEGTQAWLDSYHGFKQSNLEADELTVTTGPIWAALNVDYPHHSFSHIGLFFEGANGHLPNLDFLNTASHIVQHSGVDCLLSPSNSNNSDQLRDSYFSTNSILSFLDSPEVKEYQRNSINLWRQLRNGAVGKASGPEGVYGKYRIDSITLFGVPSGGPHGFHALGRAIESTFRSLNNLLERFHASAFLYLMTSVTSFITVGNYLAAPILLSASMTILGLSICAECFSNDVPEIEKILTGNSRVMEAFGVIGATHLIGGGIYFLTLKLNPLVPLSQSIRHTVFTVLAFTPVFLSLLLSPSPTAIPSKAPLSSMIKSFNLIESGMLIAVASTLNIGLAIFLSLLLLIPLSFAKVRNREWSAALQQIGFVIVNPLVTWGIWRLLEESSADLWMKDVLVEFVIGESWLVPVICLVVVPLLLQGATATLL